MNPPRWLIANCLTCEWHRFVGDSTDELACRHCNCWCTLCLASALISLVMIGPAMDEFLASLQHLRRVFDEGGSLWRAFWGLDEHPEDDAGSPAGARSGLEAA